MKLLVCVCAVASLFFCSTSVFAYANNNAYRNAAPVAGPSEDNSLDESDTISSGNARPDDPEMQPADSKNPGLQPDASHNPGLQPDD